MKEPSGQYVPDGVYQYVLKTTLDFQNARPQIVKMPMLVDSIASKFSDINVTPKNGKYEITFYVEDNVSDFNLAVVYVNGQIRELSPGVTSLLFNKETKSIVILAINFAGNVSWTTCGDQSYI